MKLADDALLAIMATFRKGLVEGLDISDLLRRIDLTEDLDGKLRLNPEKIDIWSEKD